MQPLQLFSIFRESSAKPTLLFQYVLLLFEKSILVSNNCHSRAIEFPKINPSNRYNESRRTKSIELLALEENEIEVCLTDWRRWWQCSQNNTRKKQKKQRRNTQTNQLLPTLPHIFIYFSCRLLRLNFLYNFERAFNSLNKDFGFIRSFSNLVRSSLLNKY